MVKINYFEFRDENNKLKLVYARSKTEAKKIAIELGFLKKENDLGLKKFKCFERYELLNDGSWTKEYLAEIRGVCKEKWEKSNNSKQIFPHNLSPSVLKAPFTNMDLDKIEKNLDKSGYCYISHDENFVYFIPKL